MASLEMESWEKNMLFETTLLLILNDDNLFTFCVLVR